MTTLDICLHPILHSEQYILTHGVGLVEWVSLCEEPEEPEVPVGGTIDTLRIVSSAISEETP